MGGKVVEVIFLGRLSTTGRLLDSDMSGFNPGEHHLLLDALLHPVACLLRILAAAAVFLSKF